MSDSITVNGVPLRLIRDDITALDIECFVFYARPDLKLGSGFGTAVSVRGGPSIQEELNTLGPLAVTDVVSTSAGELKAKLIIHAVGPAFQEEQIESKLRATVTNALKEAERKGVTRIAFPAMGAGFYGVSLDVCADVMIGTIAEHLSAAKSSLEEVIICVLDNREFNPFRARLGQPAVV
jgi:O-acetyl-ADP-ribose deacetylase (regulator of RNase III)